MYELNYYDSKQIKKIRLYNKNTFFPLTFNKNIIISKNEILRDHRITIIFQYQIELYVLIIYDFAGTYLEFNFYLLILGVSKI